MPALDLAQRLPTFCLGNSNPIKHLLHKASKQIHIHSSATAGTQVFGFLLSGLLGTKKLVLLLGQGSLHWQPREVRVCLLTSCDSRACTTLTDTTERPRGECWVNSSPSRSAPRWRLCQLHPPCVSCPWRSFLFLHPSAVRHLRHPAWVQAAAAIKTNQFALE